MTGSRFTNETTVLWNGQQLPTTYISDTQVRVCIPASNLKEAGYNDVTALTPGVGTSDPAIFTVNNLSLNGVSITLSPDRALAGSGDTPVTVNGSGFVPGTKIQWNGIDLPTEYVGPNQVKIVVPASYLKNPGNAQVIAINPGPGGGISNPASFNIFLKITTPDDDQCPIPLVVNQTINLGPPPTVEGKIDTVNSASFYAETLSPDELVTTYGDFGNTNHEFHRCDRITITDSSGATLTGTVLKVTPRQMDWLMPGGLKDGPGTITIQSYLHPGMITEKVEIARVSPGLFSADRDGNGIVLGAAVRIRADGSQVQESFVQSDNSTAIPIDLGSETDQVVLVMCGTGFRHHNSLETVTVTVDGAPLKVLYSGLVPDLPGYDQVNVLIPRLLIGRGEISLMVNHGSKMHNVVKVHIK